MAASQTNYFVGKDGKATVAGVDVNVEGWSVDPTADEHDVTSTRTAGFGGVITGVKRCKGVLTMSFDAAANPLDNPPALAIGTTVTSVKLYLNGTSNPYWDLPIIKVTGNPMESKVADVTKITINWTADGTFTDPTGNWSPS